MNTNSNINKAVQSKTRNIAYWITTVILAFVLLSAGIAELLHFSGNVDGIVKQLGYPMYFLTIQGVWKILGSIAIVAPRLRLLKEWAYAGVMFNMTGAAISSAAVGLGAAHIIPPVLIAIITVVSWMLYPSSRKLASLLPEYYNQ